MRMIRGGASEASADEIRSSARSAELPTYESHLIGFRPVRTLKPAP
jgi:formylglycine-generating enzyme required for sulfatase activity